MIIYLRSIAFYLSVFLFGLIIWFGHVTGVEAASSTQISIKNFAFSPSDVTIKPETTVTWTNNDTTAHTTTSDTGGGIAWDSGPIPQGQSYSKIFSTIGNFSYHCSIHPNMHGTIHVVAASAHTTTPSPILISSSTPMVMANEENEYSASPEPMTRTYATTRQLPKTGPPLAGLALIGLLPIGLKLRHYGK